MKDIANASGELPSALAQTMIGLLWGSAGAGAATALIGKEGFQLYGLALFVICVVVGLAIYGVERWSAIAEWRRRGEAIEQKGRDDLEQLASLYAASLKDAGSLLAVRLERRGKEMASLLESRDIEKTIFNMTNLGTDVLTILINDFRVRAKGKLKPDLSSEVISGFREGLKEIVGHWQDLCVTGVRLGEGPPDMDAQPVQVSAQE